MQHEAPGNQAPRAAAFQDITTIKHICMKLLMP